MPRRLLLSLAAAASVLTMTAMPAAAAPSGANGQILFSSVRGEAENYDIYSMKADGSDVLQLTSESNSDQMAVESPDGGNIAFMRDNFLYVMNNDGAGSSQTPVVETGAGRDPTWTPSGAIVFTWRPVQGTFPDLYIVSRDSNGNWTAPVQLTFDNAIDRAADVSPDGTRIVWEREGTSGKEIWSMNIDGTDPVQLTSNTHLDEDPAWSPDGSRIAFISAGAVTAGVFTMTPSGQDTTPVTAIGSVERVNWAPDGTKLVFATNAPEREIYVTGTDGLGTVNVTNDAADDVTPSWSGTDVAPVITGDLQPGGIVTVSQGQHRGPPAQSFSYQWYRCDDAGNNCEQIDGATASTYTVQTDDVGHRLRADTGRTPTPPQGSTMSDPSGLVQGPQVSAPQGDPQNIPRIQGTLAVGSTLTATTGGWTGTQPITFTYQWLRCEGNACSQIAGATGSTYTATTGDAGRGLLLYVTATNAHGRETRTSGAPTRAVPIPQTPPPPVPPPPSPPPPPAVAPPPPPTPVTPAPQPPRCKNRQLSGCTPRLPHTPHPGQDAHDADPARDCATGGANTGTLPSKRGGSVLILCRTVDGGLRSAESLAAVRMGFGVRVVSDAEWVSMSRQQFDGYRALVLGDPNCGTGDTMPGYAAAAAQRNAGTWTPTVGGNVIVFGTDVTHHRYDVVESGMAFAVAKPQTGAYITLSCYYHAALGSLPKPVPVLSGFGRFTVKGVGCYNAAHVVATAPQLDNVTDELLSDWSCSVHEALASWDKSFNVFAVARDAGNEYLARDGTRGTPYIVARGVKPKTPAQCVRKGYRTILGTEDPDQIRGTKGDDIICGLGADDSILGLGGDDVIYGGDDEGMAESGVDRISGGDGDDHVYGSDGDDQLFGHDGKDFLWGGSGKDLLDGGGGDNFLYGLDDADELRSGSGLNHLFGGRGRDLCFQTKTGVRDSCETPKREPSRPKPDSPWHVPREPAS